MRNVDGAFWALTSMISLSLSTTKPQMLQVGFVWVFCLQEVPEVAEELLEDPVLALHCLHNDLHHVCAVTVGMICKGQQPPR